MDNYLFSTMEASTPPAHRDWTKLLRHHCRPDHRRSAIEIAATVIPLIALWILAWLALSVSIFLTLLITVPAAGFLVRLFLIQHDCGHSALFKQRHINHWVGRVIGVFTLTPYDVWRHKHTIHHATSGNLHHRGTGDVRTLTIEEYQALPFWSRLQYRLYRHPLVLFILGPAYIFLLQHRIPSGLMKTGQYWPWISAMTTNLAIAFVCTIMIWLVGLYPFLIIQLPITLLAASIGVWLFYIQHQFEDTYWAEEPQWNHQEAALFGSSYYDLPHILRWTTANIGIHHVHHLLSRIPFYRLDDILKEHPELRNIRRLTLWDSIATINLSLWDERNKRLVTFRQAASRA